MNDAPENIKRKKQMNATKALMLEFIIENSIIHAKRWKAYSLSKLLMFEKSNKKTSVVSNSKTLISTMESF